MIFEDAYHRLKELQREMDVLPMHEAEEWTKLCDEAIHCLTEMSQHYRCYYPVQVDALRVAQLRENSDAS